MATLKELRLRFRDAKNSFTGKQAVIDEYNALTEQISKISDNIPSEDPFKQHVLGHLRRINEETLVHADNVGAVYIASYDPWKGNRIKTQQKIEEYKQLLQTIRDVGLLNQHQR